MTLGHEFSGEVVEIGSDIPENGLRVGDRVAVQPTIRCGKCIPCLEGNTNCCGSMGFVGLMGWGGGLSDYVCVDAKFAFKLPDSISTEVGGEWSQMTALNQRMMGMLIESNCQHWSSRSR